MRTLPEALIFIHLKDVKLTCLTLFLFTSTVKVNMLLESFTFAGFKELTIREETSFKNKLLTILGIMSFSISNLVKLVAKLTFHCEVHKLIKDDTLYFYSFEGFVITAAIWTAHVRGDMSLT